MSALHDPERLSEEIRGLVWDLTRRFRSESAHVSDIPLAQQVVLNRLRQTPGQTSAELARSELVRPQSMNATVAALRDSGLVESQASEQDARALRLFLTDAGREVLGDIASSRHDWLRMRLAVDLGDQERRLLGEAVTILRQLAES